MKSNPFVSIIVVNYNTSNEVLDLLACLDQCTYTNYEVLVIDNASPNDNLDSIKAQHPEVRTIESTKNLGFAGANNIGIDAAKGAYYLFLNPDTCPQPDFLEPMVELLEQNPKIGLASPKIKYYHQPELIQYAGTAEMSKWTMRSHSHSKHQKDNPQNSISGPTGYGHGAAMMVPRAVVEKVGKMNEDYFLYYEELDWCERIRQQGYLIYYMASSLVFHKESVAIEKESPLKIFYMSRNRILYARMHYNIAQFIFYAFYTLLVALPKNIITLINKPILLKAYLKGILWHFSKSTTL